MRDQDKSPRGASCETSLVRDSHPNPRAATRVQTGRKGGPRVERLGKSKRLDVLFGASRRLHRHRLETDRDSRETN